MRNNKGVTLVELLIVIVILGIIAAISIPAVGRIVENSQKDAVIADAITIRNALNTYCTQNSQDDVCRGTAVFTNVEAFDGEDAVGPTGTLDEYYEGLSGDVKFVAYRLADDDIKVVLYNDNTLFGITEEVAPSALERADVRDDLEDLEAWQTVVLALNDLDGLTLED